MSEFRSFSHARRAPAEPLQPLIDPAGWEPQELAADDGWIYRLSGAEVDDLLGGIESVRRRGLAIADMKPGDFPLGAMAEVLADVRQELLDGRGLVMLRGLPVDALGLQGSAIAHFGIGTHLGGSLMQNPQGHVLGHIKDLGGDFSDPNTRGYITNSEMKFHADHCDYVGLLCLQTAKSGGESRVASSVTLYNRILQTRPDLARVLCEDWYWTKHGQVNSADEAPWYKQPVFVFKDGYFSAKGLSSYVLKAQGLPGVPDFTDAQREAVAVYRETVEVCAVDMSFEPGDVQLLHNHVMLHSRRAYVDWPGTERKRHLFRLWLRDPDGRPVPDYMRKGMFGGGIELDGVDASAPLDVEAA